jgi:biotin synthase-related radical SAM superfamily protein
MSDKIILPLYIETGKKKVKRYYLNLNVYRNTHFTILNNIKKQYTDICIDNLKNTKQYNELFIQYKLFPKKLCDVNNICCVVDKFFLDALVHAKKIPDDNCKVVKQTLFSFGEFDKINPRIEIELFDLNSYKLTLERNTTNENDC